MTARAIWKAHLDFGETRVPVKLYSGVEDRRIHFRLLHAKDGVPVEQHMVHPKTDEIVPNDEVRRGFELEDGSFVILTEEELASVRAEPSRSIEILRFVDPERIDHRWYDRPYYLGPDGDPAPWSALVEALEATGKEGVVRWVMRNRRYVGALRVEDGVPVLVTLRSPREVVSTEELDAPSGPELDDKELDMAERLLAGLEDSFDPGDYRNEYRERVRELIDAKAEGKVVKLPEKADRIEADEDLKGALEASLRHLKESA